MANLIQYYDIFKDITQKNTYTPIFEEKMVMFINEEYQNLPLHGWKIHISSTVENSLEIFYICAKYLINNNINFKCLKNIDILKRINDKNCSRSNFGKFITVYPMDSKQAEEILEELSELLEKFDSPYILNDLRYKNCKSLYFRYGRMKFIHGETEEEKKQIKLKNGKIIADPRLPYFYLPEEIKWPFKFKIEDDNLDKLLLHEKYEVIKAISLSSKGGIYLAKYKNKEFIIKEYRPNVYVINNFTGEYTYNNEKNVYEKLTEYNFTPKLYDSFKEWEHFYLVLEKVNGETLTNYLAQNMKIYHYENSRRNYIKIVKDILLQIASIIEVLHDMDYVLGDISSENFLIDENNKVYAIDFESCYKIYNTENNYIGTKGFFHPEVKHRVTGKQKDIVGFGFLAMKLFSNSNFLINISYSLCLKNFKLVKKHLKIPEYIYELIELCTSPDYELSIKGIIRCLNSEDIFEIKLYSIINKLEKKICNINRDKDIINEIILELDIGISTDFNKVLSENNFSLIDGAMAILYDSILKNEKFVKIEKYTEIIFENIKYKNNLINGFQIQQTNRYSPYLYNGTCGFLFLLQIMRKHNEYRNIFSRYENFYYRALQELSKLIIYKTSIAEGLSGVIFIYVNEYRHTKKSEYLDILKGLTEQLFSFCIVEDGEIFFSNQHFEKANSSFRDGDYGILLVLQSVLELLK
ncbi:protein kinase domain-containing protein [Staphylococcus delphini]|uniref:class III lanthionine synthetase LanKC N-terminal domain-containing protein n=1 Tax=Staphylococcus delphini TaxID=53344 RepID=UPI000BBBE588|nr:protein kinase [Staphylococcus delphini]PCF38289.1 hypothetical protein B5C06_12040 [Staphylococcus delphini]